MLEQIEPVAKPVVTAEQILACLLAEYEYWRKCEDDNQAGADDGIIIGATAAISNVISYATIKSFRASWHPEKRSKPAHLPQAASEYDEYEAQVRQIFNDARESLGMPLLGPEALTDALSKPVCVHCAGTGKSNDARLTEDCPDCDGSGVPPGFDNVSF